MRNINGYVFIPKFKNQEIVFEPLFGPNVGQNCKKVYDNLENNGILTFSDYCSAVQSAEVYLREMGDCENIGFGRIRMKIAESEKEADRFRRLEKLVVIMKSGDFQGEKFLGPVVEEGIGFGAIPGGFLISNRFQTYTFENSLGMSPFERAKYLAEEVHRQGQCGATIATFNLRRFKRILVR